MIVHTIFALIDQDLIKNVIVGDYTHAHTLAHALYGPDAFALEVTQYPVQEGDKYIDHEFRRYENEEIYTVIERIPTDTEEIIQLKEENTELLSSMNALESTVDSILTEVIPSVMSM